MSIASLNCFFLLKALENAGLLPGGDMTPEAALTKLSYVLARTDLSTSEKQQVTTVIM